MGQTTPTAADAVDLLNQLCALDRDAMQALVAARVPCNQALGDHPTVQVGARPDDGSYTLGLLGVLNGLFGVIDVGEYSGCGHIAAKFDATGNLLGFTVLGRPDRPSFPRIE
jgi:hypothetical protein